MSNILEIKNLRKLYSGFALKGVSFSLPKGYIMGLIGPNGAGKTTTIKSILQMISPDSGEIKILGKTLSSDNRDVMNNVGVVTDLPYYVFDWKVKEVEKALAPFYKRWEHWQFKRYLQQFGLDPEKKVHELSRGMKVKLMLAVALSHNARLLVLDEPTSGLDPFARDELMTILSEFISDENNSVLFSTHITSDLEKIADYITFIRNGNIEFTEEKDVLMDSYKIVKGDESELSLEQKHLIIGYQAHHLGFNGMIRTDDIKKMPPSISYEQITLDELIVYMNRGGVTHK